MDELLFQIPDSDDTVIGEPNSTRQPHPFDGNSLYYGDLSVADSDQAASSGRFANPMGGSDIKAAQEMALPANTKKNTSWRMERLEFLLPLSFPN